jgi:hypothetical protein
LEQAMRLHHPPDSIPSRAVFFLEEKMKRSAALQIVREGSFELATSARKALPFFTPDGEGAWVAGWSPRPIYPAQKTVAFKTDAVFRLNHLGEESTWTVLSAEPKSNFAEYIYHVHGERLSRVRVQLVPLGCRRCRVHVRYVHTALSAKGRRFLAALTPSAYQQKMKDWQRMVSRSL